MANPDPGQAANDAFASAIAFIPGGTAILNVAILLFVTFFFTSTMSSHVLEYIAGLINLRGKNLKQRLRKSLGKWITRNIYEAPLIRSLVGTSGTWGAASYIERDIFARAFADLYKLGEPLPAAANPLAKPNLSRREQARAKAEIEADGEGRALIQKLQDEAKGKPDEYLKSIGEWFDALNERLNGTYTRWSTGRLFLIGLVLAVALDIDTVHYAGSMFANPDLAKKLVDDVAAAMPKDAPSDLSTLTEDQRKKLDEAVAAAWKSAKAGDATGGYGWQVVPKEPKDWLVKILGWLLTGIATSLGAQFWFNLLSESLKLRAAGPKPGEEKKTDSKAGGTKT